MQTVQASAHRIHVASRALRPPNFHAAYPLAPRQFSQKSPRLLLISNRSVARPQLPFLYPGGQTLVSNGQILRLFSISASSRKYLKDTAKLTVKYTFLIWVVTTLFSIASLGFLSERQERAFPSPHEWSLYTRFRFRRGRWWEVPENNEDEGFPNYARLYAEYQHAQRRLEDPDIDGAGIVELKEDTHGVGATGFDLTAKSGEWRQGYYEVLMGMGRAAENMEGWVSDKWKWNAWSPEFIESPSNPRPKATPPGMQSPPAKEDQIAITEPPENFYLRILRSRGFTTHQRLTAALAYADWLSFKRDYASAEEMYQEALDIAIAGLPTPNPAAVVDPKTAVLASNAPKEAITPNLVFAATNMATFLASTGNVTSALPIFISVLRARMAVPAAPATLHDTPQDSTFLGTVLSLLKEPDYPPLPPTGDEPLIRTDAERCEEAALKNYIGEILFATASTPSQRQQGLNWVRDGVSAAKIAQSFDIIKKDAKARKKCETCEEVGLESWGKMMTYLAAEAREQRDAAAQGGGWGVGSLWQWATGPGKEALAKKVEDLEDEEEGVTMRLNKLRGKIMREEYAEMDRKYGRVFAF